MAAGPGQQLQRARLYFVCDRLDGGERLERLLDAALAGGVDLLQLRDHDASDTQLLEAAAIFRRAADRRGVPFLINDRPELVGPAGADGVHVGQGDAPVDDARRVAGPEAIVGLSTHSPEQLEAAQRAAWTRRPDYLSVGPVHPTPTKPGRPAAGPAYVRHAAAHAEIPWFAIGGINPGSIGEVLDAGARRIVVVRAIRDAEEPGLAARRLGDALDQRGAPAPAALPGAGR